MLTVLQYGFSERIDKGQDSYIKFISVLTDHFWACETWWNAFIVNNL